MYITIELSNCGRLLMLAHAGCIRISLTCPRKRTAAPCSMSPSLMKAMAEELKGTKVSGATIHLTIENSLSRELTERIVRERIKEIGLAQSAVEWSKRLGKRPESVT